MTKVTRKEINERLVALTSELDRLESELDNIQRMNEEVALSTERDCRVVAQKFSVQIHVISDRIAKLVVSIANLREFRSRLAETKEINSNSSLGYPDMPLNEEIDRALIHTGEGLIELNGYRELFWNELEPFHETYPF